LLHTLTCPKRTERKSRHIKRRQIKKTDSGGEHLEGEKKEKQKNTKRLRKRGPDAQESDVKKRKEGQHTG